MNDQSRTAAASLSLLNKYQCVLVYRHNACKCKCRCTFVQKKKCLKIYNSEKQQRNKHIINQEKKHTMKRKVNLWRRKPITLPPQKRIIIRRDPPWAKRHGGPRRCHQNENLNREDHYNHCRRVDDCGFSHVEDSRQRRHTAWSTEVALHGGPAGERTALDPL